MTFPPSGPADDAQLAEAAREPAIDEILGLLSRGYASSAAERAEAALAERPDHAEVQRLLGVALFRLGRTAQAVEALQRAVGLAPETPAAVWGLAEALAADGRRAEAEAALTDLLARIGEEPVARVFLARLRLDAGDSAAAYAHAQQAVESDPQVEGGLQILGPLAFERGAFAEAAAALGPLRAASPDPAGMLARSLYTLGRHKALSGLGQAEDRAQAFLEAVLVALAAWRENNLEALATALGRAEALRDEAERTARAGGTEVRLQQMATLADLLRRLAERRRSRPDLYQGEVERLLVVVGDAQVLSAGHLVVPWRDGRALLLPDTILDAAPSGLFDPADTRGLRLRSGLAAAFARLPEAADVAVCLGDLDLRLTGGLYQRLHAAEAGELHAALDRLAQTVVQVVVDLGRAHGRTPAVVVPPASNAPLTLIGEDKRVRFQEAHKRFAAALRQAVAAAGLPAIDLRAVSERAGRVQGQLYVDTNHLWPEAWAQAFAVAAPSEGTA